MKRFAVPLGAIAALASLQAGCIAAEFNAAKCLIDGRWSNCNVELSDGTIRMALLPSTSKETKARSKEANEEQPAESVVVEGSTVQEYAYMNRSDLKSNVPVVVLGAILIPFTFGLTADAIAAKRSEHQYVYAMKVKDGQGSSLLTPDKNKFKTYIIELSDFKQSTRFYPYLREVTGLEMGMKRP